jgi:DNA-binding LytR/AlgR family response regulator
VGAEGDYVRLYVPGRSYLHRETMSAMERRLAPGEFVRIHRSTIVRAARIRELRALPNGEYVVVLRDGTELRASRSYADRLRERFGAGL